MPAHKATPSNNEKNVFFRRGRHGSWKDGWRELARVIRWNDFATRLFLKFSSHATRLVVNNRQFAASSSTFSSALNDIPIWPDLSTMARKYTQEEKQTLLDNLDFEGMSKKITCFLSKFDPFTIFASSRRPDAKTQCIPRRRPRELYSSSGKSNSSNPGASPEHDHARVERQVQRGRSRGFERRFARRIERKVYWRDSKEP